MKETPHTNVDWERKLTDDEIIYNQQSAQNIREIFQLLESATPTHPETGEVGFFVKYVGFFPRIRPLYQTQSGKKFTTNQF